MVLFLVGCSTNEEQNLEQQSLTKINVVKAKSAKFQKELTLYGTFKAKDDIAVASSLQGMQILSVEVEVSEQVQKEQILAYLENISARSQLEQAKSDLVAQEVALKEAISIFKRYENLIKEKALSKQEFE